MEFPLYLRIPGWCPQADVTVNGAAVERRRTHGFVKIARRWRKGDVVNLRFPMRPRIERGFETRYPAADRDYFRFMPAPVFQSRRLPYAALCSGPLLFSLPIPDVDPNTPVKDAKWQYAFDAAAARASVQSSGGRCRHTGTGRWTPLSVDRAGAGVRLASQRRPGVPDGPVVGDSSETIRLVPYGCTKFRISMFPVTPKAAGKALP